MSESTEYVIIEPEPGSPRFQKCDLYLVPWENFASVFPVWLEDVPVGCPVQVKLTVVRMTVAERDTFCEEYGFAWGEHY